MGPEAPFLAAGAVAIAGGVARDKAFPPEGMTAVVGTVFLVIIASATANTKAAPLVRAVGMLLLMAAIFSVAKYLPKPKKVVKKHG